MASNHRSRADQAVVHSDPEILGGAAVFVGTRVPLKNLFDYLEAGESLEKFLDAFPTVSREQAVIALEQANELLTASAREDRLRERRRTRRRKEVRRFAMEHAGSELDLDPELEAAATEALQRFY